MYVLLMLSKKRRNEKTLRLSLSLAIDNIFHVHGFPPGVVCGSQHEFIERNVHWGLDVNALTYGIPPYFYLTLFLLIIQLKLSESLSCNDEHA